VSLVLSSLAAEYRLAVNYAIEVLSEIEAILEAENHPVLRALVTSMKSDLEAHVTLSVLLEEAAKSMKSGAEETETKTTIALPEPPEEVTEPVPEEVGLYAEPNQA